MRGIFLSLPSAILFISPSLQKNKRATLIYLQKSRVYRSQIFFHIYKTRASIKALLLKRDSIRSASGIGAFRAAVVKTHDAILFFLLARGHWRSEKTYYRVIVKRCSRSGNSDARRRTSDV